MGYTTSLLGVLWLITSFIHSDGDILQETENSNVFNIGEIFGFNSRTKEKSLYNLQSNAIEPPLKIGSFNIQTLSAKKLRNRDVMSTVEKVILRYDLILLMEIILTDTQPLRKLLVDINRLAPVGATFDIVTSNGHPATNELCAFIYRTDKLSVVRTEMYPNLAGTFYRQPYIVVFNTRTLRDMDRFVAVGLHAKPTQAVQEIDALADVYDYIRQEYQIKDVILMGDFNADCDYVKENDWSTIKLWAREDFVWPIEKHYDTTTNYRSCALDRFVYAGENMNDGVILSSAKVFNFRDAFSLTQKQTKEVSDHFPIEIQIRGKMSTSVENNLISNVCFTISDTRIFKLALPESNIATKAKSSGFSVTVNLPELKILRSATYDGPFALQSLKNLRKFFPEVFTEEQLQGAIYKIQGGSLKDESSKADVESPMFTTSLIYQENMSTILICRKSTIN